MGLKCLLVAVLFMSPSVFGRDCNNILHATNICNECIRCGGKWCSDVEEEQHCIGGQSDDNWCYANQEKLPVLNTTLPFPSKGSYFDPLYVEKRAFVGSETVKSIRILHPPPVKTSVLQPYYKIVGSEESTVPNENIKIKINIQGDSLIVRSTFGTEFCSPNSTTSESVTVKVGIKGGSEEVSLTYHVPCACGCADRVEKNSSVCNGYGDLSCGVCLCREDRKGLRCEEKKCLDRGDNPPTCVNPYKPEVQCSGNGHCNECNECECFTDLDIEGSQYLHPDNNCEDLCFATSKCADCLHNGTLGQCDSCDTAYMYIVKANTSALEEIEQGRKVWVHCNMTGGCLEYAAMQRNGKKHVMILKVCKEIYDSQVGGAGITVPVVSGLIAVALMMAAAAVGYMVWKGKAAPLPLASPEYTNIDAEDCTGVNPLYKPPTSSFKNPMYGKS